MICANCTEESVADATVCPACGTSPTLDGRYRLDEIVGSGAHGTTYRATRLEDGATVAIKELLVRKVDSLKSIELFEREARVLGELDHPGIPAFFDELSVDAGRSLALYLVQEFVAGETLAAEFEERRGTDEDVFEIAAELLDTLAYLHRLNPPVIHRDIKPSNVLRRPDGRLVLIDFGSVRDAVDTAEGGSTVAGTFGFMAPEQFMGRALPATDIYGVGAMIVALLTRQDPQKLLDAERSIDWRGKVSVRPGLDRILSQMLETDPAKRASDAARLAEQIRAVLRGEWEQVPAPPAGVPPAPRPLPEDFRKKYVPGSSFPLLFGGIFAGAGVFAALIPAALSVIAGAPVWLLAMSVMFLLIFGGIGGVSLSVGLRNVMSARRAYIHGEPVQGILVDRAKSNYSVNGRQADLYAYEYLVGEKIHQGTYETFDELSLAEGDAVTALVDPSDPSNSVLYEPSRYDLKTQLRAMLRASQSPEVELDFGSAASTQAVEAHEESRVRR